MGLAARSWRCLEPYVGPLWLLHRAPFYKLGFRSFFKNKFIFTYLFLAALGLRCCTRAFSSSGERGLLFIAMRGLLIAVASLVAEHGL